jgi:hypothetical protein
MIGASFDSTKTPLHDLLARADRGKLQLPDFQRGWVWLLQRIEVATGKTSESEELFRAGVGTDAYDEGPEEWDAEGSLDGAVS